METNTSKLTYDIVIATRNRPEALAISIPLMLSSQIKPSKFIVMDSSDNHAVVQSAVQEAVKDYQGEVIILHTNQPGTSRQRNIGMAHSSADIIIFPDDDSLFFNNTIDEILRIYNLDVAMQVSGVCPAEASYPPPEANLKQAYDQSKSETFKKAISGLRFKLERKFFLDPFLALGRELSRKHSSPEWLERENCVCVEYMTGFRMSFRAHVIKKVKFNESFTKYGLFEDTEASFGALQQGLLLGARNTKIYHHKFPGVRSNGQNLGFMQIFNRAYIIGKFRNDNSKIRSIFIRYALYKLFQYALVCTGKFQRERFLGAFKACKQYKRLLDARPQDIDKIYRETTSKP